MAKAKTRSAPRITKLKPRRGAPGKSQPILPLKTGAGLLLLCVFVWFGYAGFNDRTYDAFSEAGDGAFGRRNFDYAERMYREALQEAERIDPAGSKVVETLLDLGRTYKALGRNELAGDMLERARAIRGRRG